VSQSIFHSKITFNYSLMKLKKFKKFSRFSQLLMTRRVINIYRSLPSNKRFKYLPVYHHVKKLFFSTCYEMLRVLKDTMPTTNKNNLKTWLLSIGIEAQQLHNNKCEIKSFNTNMINKQDDLR